MSTAVQRGADRERWWSSRWRPSAPTRRQITAEATFEALDIDSLDLAELSQIVHERFGVELKGSDVAEVKTVEDAIELIARARR